MPPVVKFILIALMLVFVLAIATSTRSITCTVIGGLLLLAGIFVYQIVA